MQDIKFTKKLAEFVAGTKYGDLPVEAINAAKNMIMDTLGCGIAGYVISQEEVEPVIKLCDEIGGNAESTVIVKGSKTSWFNAILINGTLMHSIDYDDTRPGPLTHTGAVVVPALLTMGEKLGSSGKDIILAAVLGYEVVFRIGSSVMPSHYQFWHSTGTNGTFGGTAVAGKLLRFNVEQIEKSLGIAADQASGLISCIEFGDLTKSLHAGLTSAKGVLAAMLMKYGATGPRGILEYPRGYCHAYSKEPTFEILVEDLGASFDIANNCPKCFPSVLGSHSAIQATLKLVKENNILSDEIDLIVGKTYTTAATTFVNRNIDTALAARLSLPYCIAVTALDREVGIQQFESNRLQDQRIKRLMERIFIEGDPELDKLYPEMFPARVEITTKSGQVYTAEEYYPKGFPKNPLSKEELEKKFEVLCSYVFENQRIEQLKKTINNLENLHNISDLLDLLIK